MQVCEVQARTQTSATREDLLFLLKKEAEQLHFLKAGLNFIQSFIGGGNQRTGPGRASASPGGLSGRFTRILHPPEALAEGGESKGENKG